jgi:hypothetical protein
VGEEPEDYRPHSITCEGEAIDVLYETQPAPADVTDFLKERGFVDAADVLATSRE